MYLSDFERFILLPRLSNRCICERHSLYLAEFFNSNNMFVPVGLEFALLCAVVVTNKVNLVGHDNV